MIVVWHPLGQSGQEAMHVLSCAHSVSLSHCLKSQLFDGQVAGWIGFSVWAWAFSSPSLFFSILHTIFHPLFSHYHLEQVSLFLFLSHSLFLLLPPHSLSPSLDSSLFLSPPLCSLPGHKIFMLSHEVVWERYGWQSSVDKVSSNLSQETGDWRASWCQKDDARGYSRPALGLSHQDRMKHQPTFAMGCGSMVCHYQVTKM